MGKLVGRKKTKKSDFLWLFGEVGKGENQD